MWNTRKVAIVTGASQAIGEGIVNRFRGRCYGVVATSRSIKPSTDADLVTVAGDIGNPETGKRRAVFSVSGSISQEPKMKEKVCRNLS